MRRVNERLQDILDAIDAIERYSQQGKVVFESQELIQVWVLYYLCIIGEAVNALPENLLDLYPEVSWKQIIGIRNRLIHEYFRIDPEIIWAVTEQDIPELRTVILKMLNELKRG